MGAALYAAWGQSARPAAVRPPAASVEELVDQAVSTGDEPAIQLTETCLRDHALNPQSDYLVATERGVRYLARGRNPAASA